MEIAPTLSALIAGVWRSIGVMIGATGVADGLPGLVPQPKAGDDVKALLGAGTYGAIATDAAINISNSTRMISGGLLTIHTRAIGTISGTGLVPNTVTVDVSPLVHNLTTGDGIIVTGTVGFDETTQQTITVTGASTFTYSTTTNTATGPESIGTISANSLFEVAAGVAEFVDHGASIEDPPTVRIPFGPFLAQTVTNIAVLEFTVINVNSAAALVQLPFTTTKQHRSLAIIGVIGHINNVTLNNPSNALAQPCPVAVQLALSDLAIVIGNINDSGNVYSPNGPNLEMDVTSGRIFVLGGNRLNDIEDPNFVSLTGGTGITFDTAWRVSSSDNTGVAGSGNPQTIVDIGVFDDGTGPAGAAAVPNGTVMNNEWVTHRIYRTPEGLTVLQFGQVTHASKADAKAAISTESFQRIAGFDAQLIRSFLVVKGNATDLSDPADAEFIEANKFGTAAASGTASGTTTLLTAYLNSAIPNIVTNGTVGPFSVQEGTGDDQADVVNFRNNAGGVTYTVRGDGVVGGGVFTTAQRDLLTALKPGDAIFNSDRNLHETYNGTFWMNSQLVQRINRSGGTLNPGAPVVQSTANADGVDSTAIASDINVLGVIVDGSGDTNPVTIAVSGHYPVEMSGTVGLGDGAVSSTTAQEATAVTIAEPGIFAVASGTRAGAGTTLINCWIQPTERF